MNTCPYCGGATKRITCGAPGCQMSLADARRATAEYREKMVAYRGTPKQMARQAAYHASDEATALRLGRMHRAVATASDAAKLAFIIGAWGAAWIIACPPTARAAECATAPDTTEVSTFGIVVLAVCSLALLLQVAIPALIDARKYGRIDRARLEARRAEIEAENDEYAAAEHDAHVAAVVDYCQEKWGRK